MRTYISARARKAISIMVAGIGTVNLSRSPKIRNPMDSLAYLGSLY